MSEASIQDELQVFLAQSPLQPIAQNIMQKFDSYYSLFVRWNARVNLSAIRDREEILTRHFVESIACAQLLPSGIATLLDFGSGGGFPGIPIALCRPEIAVTLAESQGKKAAFLQEAVRTLALNAKVHAGRAELLTERFDCVTLRAVDHMERAVATATTLVRPGGYLALLTTSRDSDRLRKAAGATFVWKLLPLPSLADDQLLALGEHSATLKSSSNL